MTELGEWQEGIITEVQRQRQGYGLDQVESADWGIRLRVRILWVALTVVFAITSARMIYLHVFEGHQNLLLSEKNHLEQVVIPAQRGKILDVHGEILAESVKDGERWVRQYPLGVAGANVIGYLSEVKPEELGCREGLCYRLGSQIGRAGVEATAENSLRGTDGGVLHEIDALGMVVRERGQVQPEAGNDVKLNLDARLQRVMYQVMDNTRVEERGVRGAAVMMRTTGEVVGMVSYPSYDPREITKFLTDTSEQYFLNRVISGTYPPGSVFKMITGYAALESGLVSAETEIEDTGEIRVGEYRYGTWNFDQAGRVEGKLNLVRALARSNDIYFYKIGEMAGIERLVKTAREFGMGERTGIDLPGEVPGLVPDPLWKERRLGEKWFLGNTYHFSIGQGDILATPIQVARMSAAVISGRLCTPQLRQQESGQCRDLAIPTKEIETIKEGMRAACSSGGTAYPFFDFEPAVLCKTGTAQHAGQKEEGDLPHAWISVVYPADNPAVVLTVLVESGGEGSAVAGPIARLILDEWKKIEK